MRRTIRKHLRDFVAIVALLVLALFVVGYLISQQEPRLNVFGINGLPFGVESTTFDLNAELSTAQAVTPSEGQAVTVSGVTIGQISSVKLEDGHAVVGLSIDDKYRGLIHTNATALLRPRTGLQDIFLEVDPGGRPAPAAQQGYTIPVQNTLPNVHLDQIFSALDSDSQAYLKLLIGGGGRGLRGRGHDLQTVFHLFLPLHRDLAKVSRAIARRRHALADLVTSLHQVNHAVAGRAPQLTSLIDASNRTLSAFAQENRSVSGTVARLPGTLRQATGTLRSVKTFADVLGPTARDLQAPAVALNRANHALIPFARTVTPTVRRRIRPFVTDARPLVRNLRSPARHLAHATPDLTKTFGVLNHLFNDAAYDPSPHDTQPYNGSKERSYLFWLAWADHNAISLFSTADANGVFRPVTIGATCETIANLIKGEPELEALMNLTPIITSLTGCDDGEGGSGAGVTFPKVPSSHQVLHRLAHGLPVHPTAGKGK